MQYVLGHVRCALCAFCVGAGSKKFGHTTERRTDVQQVCWPNFGCFDGTRKITRKSTGYEKGETRNLANNPVGEKTRGGHSGHLALAKYRTIDFLIS